MFKFCLHSLLREYGWQFVWRVALPHPFRTFKAVIASARLEHTADLITTSRDGEGCGLGADGCMVGVGFCMKPLSPPCVSGRSNHRCHYLENLPQASDAPMPECCRQCAIRQIGLLALKAGCTFYIMTSARDILFDVFEPSLRHQRYQSGLFVLCRYSLQPFAVGLIASGIRGAMVPFESGDCADYPTWLLADVGIKKDQTCVSRESRERVRELLRKAAAETDSPKRFVRHGNVLNVATANAKWNANAKWDAQMLNGTHVNRSSEAGAVRVFPA